MGLVKQEDVEATLVEPGLYGVRLIDGRHGTRGISLIRGWMAPGSRHSSHTHDMDEVIVFLGGNATMVIDGQEYPVRAGDSIHIPAGTVHSSVNHGSEDLTFVAAFADSLIGANPLHPEGAQPPAPRPLASLRLRLAWALRRLAGRLAGTG